MLKLMFSEDNPYNLRWILVCGGFIIIGVFTWMSSMVSGLGLSYILYGNQYNMRTGISLFPENKSILLCFDDGYKAFLGGCTLYGIFALLTLLAYSLPIYVLSECIKFCSGTETEIKPETEIETETKPETETKLETKLETEIRFKFGLNYFIIGLLLIGIVYGVSIGIGLAEMYVVYGRSHNMTTGMGRSARDYAEGPLICYDDHSYNFFIGCLVPGLAGWIIIPLTLALGGMLIYMVYMIVIIPPVGLFKYIYHSYEYAKKEMVLNEKSSFRRSVQ